MKHDSTCTNCKCTVCRETFRRTRQEIMDRGGPDAFNVAMETAASDEERQFYMAQAHAICDTFDYMFSWKFVRHIFAVVIIAAVLAWGAGKIPMDDTPNKIGYDYDKHFR